MESFSNFTRGEDWSDDDEGAEPEDVFEGKTKLLSRGFNETVPIDVFQREEGKEPFFPGADDADLRSQSSLGNSTNICPFPFRDPPIIPHVDMYVGKPSLRYDHLRDILNGSKKPHRRLKSIRHHGGNSSGSVSASVSQIVTTNTRSSSMDGSSSSVSGSVDDASVISSITASQIDIFMQYIQHCCLNNSFAKEIDLSGLAKAFRCHHRAEATLQEEQRMRDLLITFEYILQVCGLGVVGWFSRFQVRLGGGGRPMINQLVFCGSVRKLCEENGLPYWEWNDLKLLYTFLVQESEGDPSGLYSEDFSHVFQGQGGPDSSQRKKQLMSAVNPIINRLKKRMKKLKLRIADLYASVEPDLTRPIPLAKLSGALNGIGNAAVGAEAKSPLASKSLDDSSSFVSGMSKYGAGEVGTKLEHMSHTLDKKTQSRSYHIQKSEYLAKHYRDQKSSALAESMRLHLHQQTLLKSQASEASTMSIISRLLDDREARARLHGVIQKTWPDSITLFEMQQTELLTIASIISQRSKVPLCDVLPTLQAAEEAVGEDFAHLRHAPPSKMPGDVPKQGGVAAAGGGGAGAVGGLLSSVVMASDLPPLVLPEGVGEYSEVAQSLSKHLNTSKSVGRMLDPKSEHFRAVVRERAHELVHGLAQFDLMMDRNKKILARF